MDFWHWWYAALYCAFLQETSFRVSIISMSLKTVGSDDRDCRKPINGWLLEHSNSMNQGKAPALEHSKLFNEIKARGLQIILVSSRREHLRSATINNLVNVGFYGWTSLILRSVPLLGTGVLMMKWRGCKITRLMWENNWWVVDTAFGVFWETNTAALRDFQEPKGHSNFPTHCTMFLKESSSTNCFFRCF